jgi:hypothetical protein
VFIFISISLKSHHHNKPKNRVCRLKPENFGCSDRLAKRSSRADKPFNARQVTTVAPHPLSGFFTQRVTNLWVAALKRNFQFSSRHEI